MTAADGGGMGRRVILFLAAIAGAAVLGAVGLLAWRTEAFASGAARAEGVIVDPQPHPLVRFADARGAAVQFTQNGDAPGAAGTRVPVLYDPADPAGTARVATTGALWGTVLRLLPVAAVAAGVLALAVAGLVRR